MYFTSAIIRISILQIFFLKFQCLLILIQLSHQYIRCIQESLTENISLVIQINLQLRAVNNHSPEQICQKIVRLLSLQHLSHCIAFLRIFIDQPFDGCGNIHGVQMTNG